MSFFFPLIPALLEGNQLANVEGESVVGRTIKGIVDEQASGRFRRVVQVPEQVVSPVGAVLRYGKASYLGVQVP